MKILSFRRSGEPMTARQRGQMLVLFTLSLFVLTGITALVVDVSWYWANQLRVQRAADAAALAGVVWLPGNAPTAYSTARDEATKNGYTDGVGTVTVTPVKDPANDRRLIVTVSGSVGTFFMKVFGIPTIPVSRTAKAEYVLPVPMGSPQNYYGVYQLCSNAGTYTCVDIPGPSGGTLSSQGFFGAIEGQGTNRSTGDGFATYYNGKPTANADYDSQGYVYQIEVPSSGGTAWVFDPTFCATTSGPGGGHLGAGDHWLGPNNPSPASTYFRLWDTRGTAFLSDDILVADSGSLFVDENRTDQSPQYGNTTNAGYADQGTPSSPTDCATGKIANPLSGGYWHNKWWPIKSGLAAGSYRLQVMTTDPNSAGRNINSSFENMWSLAVTGGGAPRIYGSGRMVTYANIVSGQQLFYLAQIDQTAAGKTMEIDLFDPGDVGDKAWLQILSPDGNAYTPIRFDYTADANAAAGHQSGTNVTCIQTYGNNTAISPPAGCATNYTSGGQFYQNSWIKIQVPLPASYGSVGLTPAGETQAGWWKIKYVVNNGNDTTTWMVSLLGNPVHLVVP